MMVTLQLKRKKEIRRKRARRVQKTTINLTKSQKEENSVGMKTKTSTNKETKSQRLRKKVIIKRSNKMILLPTTKILNAVAKTKKVEGIISGT